MSEPIQWAVVAYWAERTTPSVWAPFQHRVQAQRLVEHLSRNPAVREAVLVIQWPPPASLQP
jgi:hypothetical protein